MTTTIPLGDAGRSRWLRRMLMNNLLDEIRKVAIPPELSQEPLRAAAE
jgi:hypothetical protein